ncbi:hypothetical protein A2U01_0105575, partial [Trifolium medium]|nr:hypothetical protein [Trifolium medium]
EHWRVAPVGSEDCWLGSVSYGLRRRYGVLRRLPRLHHRRVWIAGRCADSCGTARIFI